MALNFWKDDALLIILLNANDVWAVHLTRRVVCAHNFRMIKARLQQSYQFATRLRPSLVSTLSSPPPPIIMYMVQSGQLPKTIVQSVYMS